MARLMLRALATPWKPKLQQILMESRASYGKAAEFNHRVTQLLGGNALERKNE